MVDINIVINIVKSAKPFFFDRENSAQISEKGVADFVTLVDINVQNYLKSKLSKAYPSVQFMSEEKDNSDIDFSGLVWILDPVDGTTNLIHDFQGSSISLALAENGEVIMGVVYVPTSDELFYAEKNKGAFLNGRKIHVSEEKDFARALISTGSSPYHKEWADLNFEVFKKIFLDCADIRRIGSAAIELCYVACGRLDAYVEANLKQWDYAAGKIIVEEAGGKIIDYEGNAVNITYTSSLCSSNGPIGEILVQKYLPENKNFVV